MLAIASGCPVRSAAHFTGANIDGRVVLVASGTGFAPMWAIAAAAITERPQRELTFVVATPKLQSFYMHGALCRLARFPNVTIVPVVSEPQNVSFAHRGGRPIDYLPDLSPEDIVYTAGAPAMTDAVAKIARRGGRQMLHRPVCRTPARTTRRADGACRRLARRFQKEPRNCMPLSGVAGGAAANLNIFPSEKNHDEDHLHRSQEPDARSISVDNGDTVMRAAVSHGIKGIVAECGGNALCATCHVYVDEPWISKLGPVGNDEGMLLDRTVAVRRPNSRLCCQIKVTPALDGLTLRLPDRQT